MTRPSDRAASVLAVLAGVALLLAVLAGYADRSLGNSEQFANRATATLSDQAVREQIAERITDELVLQRHSALTTIRPLIKRSVSAAVASRAFTDAFRSAALAMHRMLVNGHRRKLTLTVSEVGPVVAARLAALHPAAARAVDHTSRITLLTQRIGAIGAALSHTLARLRLAAWLLLGLTFALAGAAILVARDRWRSVRRLAVATAVSGVVLLLLYTLGRRLVLHGQDTALARDVVAATWHAFLGDLLTAAWILALAGAAVAVGVGIARPSSRQAWFSTRERRRSRVAAAVATLALSAAVLLAIGSAGSASEPAPGPVACLGHMKLCGRSLDKVVLAATHNSMSGPLPGWFASQQDQPIAAQLDDGIRGLLIDTHYADRLANGRLRTELGDRTAALGDSVSPATADRARRLRERAGFKGKGTRGMYLCHSFCELGGTPLEPMLRELRDFLVANPGAVVVVVNQDYVTPADFVAAVERARLGDLVYRGPVAGHWPTLREMIDTNQRLVLFAENHAGAAPWYHLAYAKAVEETPFSFNRAARLTDPADLPASCERNRGPNSAPLFLVNHWITTDPLPLPSNASRVNAYDPLLRRVEECRRIRAHLPNLLAVDFYRRGDLFRVVDHLNGVG